MKKIGLLITMFMLLFSPVIANGATITISVDSISFEFPEYVIDSTATSIQTKVIAKYSNGTQNDVTKLTTFTLQNQNVANVNEGLITVNNETTMTIKANFKKKIATAKVIIKNPTRTPIIEEPTDPKPTPEPPVVIVPTPTPTPSENSVTKYGANGNDNIVDTVAFQKAIDDIASKGGGDVYIPSGTYVLNPIWLKSNVNLIGENKDSVTLKLANNSPDWDRMVNLDSIKDIKIQNITFDGNYANNTNGNEHMHSVFLWDAKNIIIDNNKFINAVADGISVSGSDGQSEYITISNNFLEDNHRSNIVIEQASHLKVFNNISKSNIGRPALHFEPWEYMNFNDAKIYDNTFQSTADESNVVQLEGGQGEGNYYNGLEFYHNTVNAPNGDLIIMETKGAKIYENDFNLRRVFIWIKNLDLNIYKNKMKTRNGIVFEGTWAMTSPNTIISDNTIETSDGNGISLTAAAKDTTIIRNTIFDSTGNGWYGIYMGASGADVENTKIQDNIIKNFRYGVYTDRNVYDSFWVNGVLVQGNTFENMSQYIIYASNLSSKNVTVGDNTYINAKGIYLGN